jgi:hypothetical protein
MVYGFSNMNPINSNSVVLKYKGMQLGIIKHMSINALEGVILK